MPGNRDGDDPAEAIHVLALLLQRQHQEEDRKDLPLLSRVVDGVVVGPSLSGGAMIALVAHVVAVAVWRS